MFIFANPKVSPDTHLACLKHLPVCKYVILSFRQNFFSLVFATRKLDMNKEAEGSLWRGEKKKTSQVIRREEKNFERDIAKTI